ncbi:MAG: alpha/beta fold hydrolase [Prolixibacteraceae bacterium]|nr:alpha/beta fold hydrolase [Prolixibacteraceae bacterium]MBN2774586.1 alpha/beta fold hydrolase [Prolixibacteraceae bacterium]
MKTIKHLLFLSFLIIILSLNSIAQEKAIGNWSGKLELPGTKLEIIFKISVSEENKTVAAMDVPQQGAAGISVDKIVATNDSLQLTISVINGIFSGAFADEQTLVGTWSQNGMTFPLTLSKTETVTELKRPQTPVKPYPYTEEEVSFKNKNDSVSLAGTLTIPEGPGKFPVVILITGSGAQDRDETIFGHKPFLVLADHLTRNGFAVLRTDDRGVGGSEGNIRDVTSEELAGDVLAGLEFLKNHNKIDASKIGLIGHSEGGIIAPIAANLTDDVNFIIMWAGPGINGEQILYEQGELINRAAGLTEELIQHNREIQSEIFSVLLNESDTKEIYHQLQNAYSGGMYEELSNEQKKIINQRIMGVNTPWFKFFLKYDPYPTLKKVKCPVLALIGEKDIQVPPKANLEAIEKAFTKGGNKNFKVQELKNLNHMFQNCETGAISEYGEIEETIAPEALKVMTGWLKDVTK